MKPFVHNFGLAVLAVAEAVEAINNINDLSYKE